MLRSIGKPSNQFNVGRPISARCSRFVTLSSTPGSREAERNRSRNIGWVEQVDRQNTLAWTNRSTTRRLAERTRTKLGHEYRDRLLRNKMDDRDNLGVA